MVLGLALLGLELAVTTDFFLLFLGLPALLVGAAVALGIAGPPWLQLLLYSILAVTGVLVVRRRLTARLARKVPDDGSATESLLGSVATLSSDLPAGGVARTEFRGSSWSVRSSKGQPIPQGTRCRVERVEGLVLWVSPESPG